MMKWFLDALFLGGIIDLFWKAGGNCSSLSELQVISKQGWEYKELRGLYSLETWWEGSFSAFFSCSKERNCLGSSFEGQKMYSPKSDFSWPLSFAVALFPGRQNEDLYDCVSCGRFIFFLMLGFWMMQILLGQRQLSPATVKTPVFSKTKLP